jgi:hypothetical protein
MDRRPDHKRNLQSVYDLLVHVIWNEPLLLKMASIAGPFMFR